MTTRHLKFVWPSPEPAFLVLQENDGTPVVRYESFAGSFRLIERDGRMFRLNGQDRDTDEFIYVPEVELI